MPLGPHAALMLYLTHSTFLCTLLRLVEASAVVSVAAVEPPKRRDAMKR